MELSNINIQINASNYNDTSVKASKPKDNDNDFSKVYKDVSTKDKDVNTKDKDDKIQDKSENVRDDNSLNNKISSATKDSSVDKLDNTLEDKTKNDKDLNKLIELLLMSGNTDPNLINLLKSNNKLDTKEIKDLIVKMLNGNLTNGSPSNNKVLAQTSSNKIQPSLDEITQMISANKVKFDDSIDKLASKIADKLVNDNSFKTGFLDKLSAQMQVSIGDNNNSLKEIIIKQLKSMQDKKTSNGEITSKDIKSLIRESLLTQTDKVNLPNASNEPNEGKPETLNTAENKAAPITIKVMDDSSNKEDKLLKQLADGESSKSSKDNISDKISNILNRFETIRTDKPTIVEGKVAINRVTFNADFIKAVKYMDMNNLKELSVKVLPKDLGEIVIKLSMDNGVMKASITATNKDTYTLLNSQLPAISNQLSEQNMAIQNFSLSLSNGENFLFSGDGSSNGNGKHQGKNDIKVDSIDELDSQKEQYSEDNSSVNILA